MYVLHDTIHQITLPKIPKHSCNTMRYNTLYTYFRDAVRTLPFIKYYNFPNINYIKLACCMLHYKAPSNPWYPPGPPGPRGIEINHVNFEYICGIGNVIYCNAQSSHTLYNFLHWFIIIHFKNILIVTV